MPDTSDGRTARRDRNRLAVLDTVLELFAAGDLNPSPDAVAAQSRLSLRSVYRYVADSEDLVHAAIDRHLEKVGPLLVIDRIGQGDFADRVEAFVAARLALYEAVAPTARAAELRAPTSAVLQDGLQARRQMFRIQLEQQFAPEISAAAQAGALAGSVLAAADALTQIETIGWYRDRGGYSAEQTHESLVLALGSLLGAAISQRPSALSGASDTEQARGTERS
jgi:AcrR family transcriptional regulator